jgi:tetratricopeptide (TPR) repeat protein
MADTDKSVFISYRRSTSKHLARAVFMDLRANGYDVFMDVNTIDSGEFDKIILNQIAARPHFILLLTPGALDRCNEPNDWLRQEIERAMELQRNIVPIIEEGFRFEEAKPYLVGKLSQLPKYNAVLLYHAYFEAALDNLRTRFLKQPVYAVVLTEVSTIEQSAVAEQIEEAAQEQPLTPAQQEARKYFNRAVNCQLNRDFSGAILDYGEAIRHNPQYFRAYLNRGVAKMEVEDFAGAVLDFNHAIRLNPKDAEAYNLRGLAQTKRGKPELALNDYNRAIELNSRDPEAHYNRGYYYYSQGQHQAAIENFNQALQLAPNYKDYLDARAGTYYHLGEYDKAIADYSRVIEQKPESHVGYNNRAEAYFAKGDIQLALADYEKANKISANSPFVIAGLAITYHRLGQLNKAQRLWKQLVKRDTNYQNHEWVRDELHWVEPLVEQARMLILTI